MGLLIFWGIIFVIVVLHELGHLLVAKKYGVRVKTYSVGFGWRIFGIKFYKSRIGKLHTSWRFFNFKPSDPAVWNWTHLTEYRLAPILLGGFCNISGELKSTGKSYELASKPFWQKLQIALAGVATNFITGLFILLGIAIKNHGFTEGIKNTFTTIYNVIASLGTVIYLLCTGAVAITTASEVNQFMSNISIEYILTYFGILSILMAIVNSVPIPALDGSLPFLWIIEKMTGGKASKLLQVIWFTGFVILMLLQVVILYFWIFG